MKDVRHYYRTWVEIDTKKLRANVSEFLKILPQKTYFMAVIKSNAYGHGIVGIADALHHFPAFHKRGWFGVDSIVEAVRLRKEKFREPILVLGYVLPKRLSEASKNNISITVSTFETLWALAKIKKKTKIHLKFDTGMYRQGFFEKDVQKVLEFLEKHPFILLEGVYTHFASAKQYPSPETDGQFDIFKRIVRDIKRRYPKVIVHAAATGGTLFFPKTHLDMVRIGRGMCGYYPSIQAEKAFSKKIVIKPILEWHSVISEIKVAPRGAKIGYDGTEVAKRKTLLAVVPIGYWHGFDRKLSSRGFVLVRGKRAKVIGCVSMDMIVVDVTDISHAGVGDDVVIIGKSKDVQISGEELAKLLHTTVYEILTRINPLIYKVYK